MFNNNIIMNCKYQNMTGRGGKIVIYMKVGESAMYSIINIFH